MRGNIGVFIGLLFYESVSRESIKKGLRLALMLMLMLTVKVKLKSGLGLTIG